MDDWDLEGFDAVKVDEQIKWEPLLGYGKQQKDLDNWLNSKDADRKTGLPLVIITGQVGVGKSALAHLYLEKYKYDITTIYPDMFFEQNLSETSIVEEARRYQSLVSKKRAFILDSLDQFPASRFSLDKFIKLLQFNPDRIRSKTSSSKPKRRQTIKSSLVCPILILCSNRTHASLKRLSRYAVQLYLPPLDATLFTRLAKQLAKQRKISLTSSMISTMMVKCRGDIRRLKLIIEQLALLPCQGEEIKEMGQDVEYGLFLELKRSLNGQATLDQISETLYQYPHLTNVLMDHHTDNLEMVRIFSDVDILLQDSTTNMNFETKAMANDIAAFGLKLAAKNTRGLTLSLSSSRALASRHQRSKRTLCLPFFQQSPYFTTASQEELYRKLSLMYTMAEAYNPKYKTHRTEKLPHRSFLQYRFRDGRHVAETRALLPSILSGLS